MSHTEARIARGTLFIFALPGLSQGFMMGPAQSLLQGIYAEFFAVPLTALATAVLIARLFDAITDPLIGFLSDLHHRRGGSRKPWLACGAVISIVCILQLYNPPDGVDIVYFTVWFVGAFLGWTIIEVPYRAWAIELSNEYEERTRIAGAMGMAMVLGSVIFLFLPVIDSAPDTTAYVPATLSLTAMVVAILMPIFVGLALWRVPNGSAYRPSLGPDTVRGLLRSIFCNGYLLLFGLVFMLAAGALGMSSGVFFLYITKYLQRGEEFFIVAVVGIFIGAIFMPVWAKLCNRFQRHKVWAIATFVFGWVYLAYGFMDHETSMAMLIALMAINAIAGLVEYVAGPAILGDIVDYGRLKFGRDRAGTYYAFYNLMKKAAGGFGLALGLAIMGKLGFDATSTTQTDQGRLGILIAAAWIPAALSFMAVPLLWYFPLDRIRHQQILQALRDKGAAETAATEAPGAGSSEAHSPGMPA